ncbi:MAG: hypothetical protein COC19_04965 [SAR86 cluster bacterium]|uniref:Uncharacterized protein n=1 Tax=SAR86 cluster bacterium TaxID=2030880 RepID=A0A2A4MNB4_9GAMM|nr:MAG: hypothetical protein COC19_04965 [SAR86 cluster bacterium]
MTIRTVHQVISKKGLVIGEYMDLKLAKDMDNRTDVLYFIAEIIESQGVDEVLAEKIAEAMLDDGSRAELLSKIKSVKDLPADTEDDSDADSNTIDEDKH